MTTCTLTPNSKPFNENTLDELKTYYESYVNDTAITQTVKNDRNKNFNICLLQYKNETEPGDDSIESKINNYQNDLNDANNANLINDNTISLYNNDLLYIILKFCVLFLFLGIVYVVYVKKMSISSTFENLKHKTMSITDNITQKINPITQPIGQIQVKPGI
jgi:hypothetical protein